MDTKRTCPQLLCRCQIPRRARRVDAEVRVCRLAARPHGAVAADEAAAAVEALRAREAARRKRPARIGQDGREPAAPRERVEQVRERRWVEAQEVDRGEGAGRERVAHRAHAVQVAQAAHACQVRARVEQVVQVQVRKRRHVRREGRAREVLPVRRARHAVPGRESQPHVLADGADAPGCDELARGIRRGGGRKHAFAVGVVVRPEPGAGVVVRVGRDAACPELANARAARRGGHEAVGSAHQAVSAVEHEASRRAPSQGALSP